MQDIDRHVNKCIDSLAKDKSSTDRDARAMRPLPGSPPNTVTSTPIESTSKKASVFSVLMSGHKENEAWKEATEAEDRNFRPNKANGGRRKAPFYKVQI